MTIRELVAKHRPTPLDPKAVERAVREARRRKGRAVRVARKHNRKG